VQQALTGDGVEQDGGLVEDETVGFHGQNGGDGQPGLLTGGKSGRVAVPQLGETHPVQRTIHTGTERCHWQAQVLRAEGHFLFDDRRDKLVIGVLEHHAHCRADGDQGLRIARVHALHPHVPDGRPQETVQAARER